MMKIFSALFSLAALPAFTLAGDVVPIMSMYVPLPETSLLHGVFHVIKSNARAPVTTMISIAVSTDDTVIWYDHHERDGYDTDGSVAASTRVWGDGDSGNGCAPGVSPCTDATDVLIAGQVIILKNEVPVPRGNAILFDGGDKISASLPIAVTRSAYPSGEPGSMMAGAVEVIEQEQWGTRFVAPVGQDVGSETDAFEYSAFAIMAGDEGATISCPGEFKTLAQGEAVVIRVDQGWELTSDKPIQVDLITGDIGSTYQLRWYSLVPVEQWSNEYYAPVGDTKGETKVTIYNPGTRRITVTCTLPNPNDSYTFRVPAKSIRSSEIIRDGDGAKFSAGAGNNFFAFSSTDTEGGGQIYDWGYPLIPSGSLTNEVVVGLGYGCTDMNCNGDGERSVVWITAVSDATIHVDYNNDGNNVATKSVRALESVYFTDDNDEDMSGARIWAEKNGEPVNIAAAWGQKASLSKSGDDYALDLGTVILPFEPTRTSCSVDIKEDRDGDGEISAGDIVVETIEVFNVGAMPVSEGSIAVETLGGTVNVEATDGRGGTKIYTIEYEVPPGVSTVTGTCEVVPAPPTTSPTSSPTGVPTVSPTAGPTGGPTAGPTGGPTASPTGGPNETPTEAPTDPPAPDQPTPGDRTITDAPVVFVKGDPHFKTFGGELYDFHGECDLVLLHNPQFMNGLGMDVHVRTKIEDFWSSVETAAIKIGDDTLEVRANPDSDEWIWINGNLVTGIEEGKFHRASIAGFLIRYKQTSPGVREANIHVEGSKERIQLKTFKSFVRVDIPWIESVHYVGSSGLLGSYDNEGKRLGRDNKTFIKNPHKFGQEWQVTDDEPKLFHSYEGAIVGDKCKMPPVYTREAAAELLRRKRRLAESNMTEEDAEKACSHLSDPDEVKSCVFDVIATQDLSMASVW